MSAKTDLSTQHNFKLYNDDIPFRKERLTKTKKLKLNIKGISINLDSPRKQRPQSKIK